MPAYPPQLSRLRGAPYFVRWRHNPTLKLKDGVQLAAFEVVILSDETHTLRRICSAAEREELSRLKRELRVVREERDVLAKAIAFFTKDTTR